MANTGKTPADLLIDINDTIRAKTGANTITPATHSDLLDDLVTTLSATTYTGNTSGECINALYVHQLYGCSPILVRNILRLKDSASIQTTTGEDIIKDDGTIFSSEITITNIDGKTNKVLFKTPKIQGSIINGIVTTPIDETGILSNQVYRVNDFVLTLGSGTTGDTSFETGKTQVVFNDSEADGGVVMKIADANGLKKSFKLDMLDKIEVYKNPIFDDASEVISVKKLSNPTDSFNNIANDIVLYGATDCAPPYLCGDECSNFCGANNGSSASAYANCMSLCGTNTASIVIIDGAEILTRQTYKTTRDEIIFSASGGSANTASIVTQLQDNTGDSLQVYGINKLGETVAMKEIFKAKDIIIYDGILGMKSLDSIKVLTDKKEHITSIENTGTGEKLSTSGRTVFVDVGGRTRQILNEDTIFSTSGIVESHVNKVKLLGVDSFGDIRTLYISGDTGNTVTTEKSMSSNGRQKYLLNRRTKMGGIIDSSSNITQYFGVDSFEIIKTLEISGDTGTTVSHTKSLVGTGYTIDSMIPVGRGQRELVDGGNDNIWEVVQGVGFSEVYGITYSSTTGTVETIISTVATTELHNKTLKITNTLVSIPALNIASVTSGVSVGNLSIAADGRVISGATAGGTVKYVESFGFTGDSISTITHNLGTTDVIVQLKDSTGNLIIPNSVGVYTSNGVNIGVSVSGTYRVIIMG